MKRTAAVLAVGWLSIAGCGPESNRASAAHTLGGSETDSPPALTGTEIATPGVEADFTLTDTNGEPYAFGRETEGHIAVLFFGYTRCPDVCPVHMANLAAALRRLPTAVSNRVKVVFVTVDPDRDTPRQLREWLDGFDGSFVGLRGDRETVAAIQRTLGLPPAVIRQQAHYGEPEVGHAAQVLVFTPDRTRRYVYPFGTRQRDWANDLPLLARVPAQATSGSEASGGGGEAAAEAGPPGATSASGSR